MRARLLFAALAAAAALSVPVADASAQQRRAAQDWTRVAVRTPEGGVRLGNPAAQVKLVEYGSITCPHCAAFANSGGTAGLYNHVRTGRVSWEYRPYMIFPTDPGIFAALNCLPPGQFFGAVEQLYATQQSWVSLARNYIETNRSQLQRMSEPQVAAALFRASRVEGLFRARGLTPARVNACVANPANLQRVADGTRAAGQRGVQSTPTFFINGVQQGAIEFFSQLEPMLISAGARGQ